MAIHKAAVLLLFVGLVGAGCSQCDCQVESCGGSSHFAYGHPLPTPEDFSRANDECMLENGLDPEFKDLLVLENFNADNVPEAVLCTIKCGNERLGFLRPDGTLDLRKMYAGPPLSEIDRWKVGPLSHCLISIGKIRTCRDMLKKEQCMEAFDAPKPPNVL